MEADRATDANPTKYFRGPESTEQVIATILSVHQGDIQAAQVLMKWIHRLGGVEQFDLVIVADAGTPFNQVVELKAIAEQAFKTATIISTEKANVGWPTAANAQWTRAARWAKENGRAWLWLEADAIPLKKSWLQEIDAAYIMAGSKYLGHVYSCQQPYMPAQIMSGIACYPPSAIDEIAPLPLTPRAWDIDAAPIMVANGLHTDLVRHLWGQQNLPPVFVEAKDANSPINAFTLDWLPPECVLFHRDKTHSLIRILTRKYFPNDSLGTKIVVVFPVCEKDIAHAIHHAKWLRSMNRKWEHKAVIAYDYSAHVLLLNELKRTLEPCFEGVEAFHYSAPPIPTYPQAANWCWQSIAHKMAQQECPWLFMEADAVALTPDWLEKLQREYDCSTKPFMGPKVHQMGHYNGVMIYPANAANRMPRAMSCGAGQAFDMVAREDIAGDGYDCGHLFYHVWTVMGGQFCPVGGGELPVNISLELARTIPKSAVAIHRIKSNDLINLLQSGQYKHV